MCPTGTKKMGKSHSESKLGKGRCLSALDKPSHHRDEAQEGANDKQVYEIATPALLQDISLQK